MMPKDRFEKAGDKNKAYRHKERVIAAEKN
jgi:hypothetical protein